jgi:glycosyltransferase involved in cell wall biosynthesis
MTVFQVLPNLCDGGAQRVALDLYRGLRDKRDVRLVCLTGEVGPVHRQLIEDRSVVVEGVEALRSLGSSDVVHTHLSAWERVIASRPASLFTGIHVHTIHNEPIRESSRGRVAFRRLYPSGTSLVVLGDEFRVGAERIYPARRVSVIPNGVDAMAPSPEVDVRPTSRALLFVGRLEPQKDPLILIESFRELASKDEGWTLTVVGTGSLIDVVMQAAAGLPVTWLKKSDEVPDLLRAHSALILTSRWEGAPLVVLEAMAHGLPVVATDVGAIRSQLGPFGRGLVPADSSSTVIATAARNLLMDPPSRTDLRRRAAEFFSVDSMVESYLREYER